MPRPHTAPSLVIILTSLVLLAAGCGDPAAQTPVAAPSDVHLAEAAGASLPATLPAPPAGDGRLDAARAVYLYCRLVGRGQFARASALCSHHHLWSRRAFASLRGLGFRSARVFAAPDARTLVFKVRVRVHARRGCPLPDGLATLFFTLGRVGSAVGGWLITAVSTSP